MSEISLIGTQDDLHSKIVFVQLDEVKNQRQYLTPDKVDKVNKLEKINKIDEKFNDEDNLIINCSDFFTQVQIENGYIINIHSKEVENENDIRPKIDVPEGSYEKYEEIYEEMYEEFDKQEFTINLKNINDYNLNDYRKVISKCILDFSMFCKHYSLIFYAVSYFNLYISKLEVVNPDKLKLYMSTCIIIADRIHEVDQLNKYEKMMLIRSNKIDKLKEMELEISRVIEYNFLHPNISTYLERYLNISCSNVNVFKRCYYLSLCALYDPDIFNYKPSMIAASILYVVREELKITTFNVNWNNTLIKYTKYRLEDLTDCITKIREILKTINEDDVRINLVLEVKN